MKPQPKLTSTLSYTAFCILSAYTLLKSVKVSLFLRYAPASLLPAAHVIGTFLCIGIIPRFYRKHIAAPSYRLLIFGCLFGAVMPTLSALILINTTKASLDSITAMVMYICCELSTTTLLGIFWTCAHESYKADHAPEAYRKFTLAGQAACALTPLSVLASCNVIPHHLDLITFALATVLLLLATMKLHSFTPPQLLPDSREPQAKLSLVHLTRAGGIIGVFIFHRIFADLLEFRMITLLSTSCTALGISTTTFMLGYTWLSHMLGMAFLLLTTGIITTVPRTTSTFRLIPLALVVVCTSMTCYSPSLAVFAACSLLTKSLYNGIIHPTREILFLTLSSTTRRTLKLYAGGGGTLLLKSLGGGMVFLTGLTPTLFGITVLLVSGAWAGSCFAASNVSQRSALSEA